MKPIRLRLKIRQIQVVLAIADMGNLLRAAGKLHITQPAISKALTVIEEDIGERLFDRTPYGARPTPAGEVVIRHGRNVLADIQRMQDDLEATLRGDTGSLRLGVFSLISDWEAINQAIIQAKAKAPGLTLVIDTGKMEDLIEKLDGGQLDVVIGRYPYTAQQGHHTINGITRDRIVAVVRQEHPLLQEADEPDFRQLLDYPWVLPPKDNHVRMQLELEVSAMGAQLSETSVVSLSIPINTGLIRSTDSIMMMPKCVAKALERSHGLRIVPCELPLSVGPLVAIWRSDRVVDQLRDIFIDELEEAVALENEGADNLPRPE
ncbi:LysR family transcriptional regulator [Leisingera sp. ANG-Vp]|uniref:LysR family transcriptional regulator n=1 Tax=Leisingera sp. ANG-Vp TaxID=1577896 RepID=UPI0006892CED|nr:LysR family transcriptional regulator [Leisingera sp. ANG-Vp]